MQIFQKNFLLITLQEEDLFCKKGMEVFACLCYTDFIGNYDIHCPLSDPEGLQLYSFKANEYGEKIVK